MENSITRGPVRVPRVRDIAGFARPRVRVPSPPRKSFPCPVPCPACFLCTCFFATRHKKAPTFRPGLFRGGVLLTLFHVFARGQLCRLEFVALGIALYLGKLSGHQIADLDKFGLV